MQQSTVASPFSGQRRVTTMAAKGVSSLMLACAALRSFLVEGNAR
jgi:hypothetical protein